MTDETLPDPLSWKPLKSPSLIEFEVIATEAFRGLPAHFRTRCEGVIIRVEDYATDEVLNAMEIPNELDLMGLFQGVGLPFQSDSAPAQMPNMVWLYRVPILLYWAEHEETSGISSRMCWCMRSVIISDCPMMICTGSKRRRNKRRSSMKVNGGCHCGFITIEGDADPEKVTVCHCTDCQTGTGSAFRVSVPMAGSVFKMKGQPANYLKTTSDSGNPRVQAFCPKCGSPIYSTSPGEGQQASYMVRVGILAQREQLAPKKQNWFRSAQSWVTGIDAVQKNPKKG